MRALHILVKFGENLHFPADHLHVNEFRFKAVIQVGDVVGDFVHEINQLRFERRALVEKIFRQLGKLLCVVVA